MPDGPDGADGFDGSALVGPVELRLSAGALEAQRLHLLVEMASLEIEEPRRLGGVVSSEGEGAQDDVALGLVDLLAEGFARGESAAGGGRGRAWGEGLRRAMRRWARRPRLAGRGLRLGPSDASPPRKQGLGLGSRDQRPLAEDCQALDQVLAARARCPGSRTPSSVGSPRAASLSSLRPFFRHDSSRKASMSVGRSRGAPAAAERESAPR